MREEHDLTRLPRLLRSPFDETVCFIPNPALESNPTAPQQCALITLESQPEVDLAVRTATTLNQQLWLGATDEAQEGKWMWVTGQPVQPAERQSWTIKNDHGGQHHLYMTINGEIYDWFAGARQAYICEWED